MCDVKVMLMIPLVPYTAPSLVSTSDLGPLADISSYDFSYLPKSISAENMNQVSCL